MSTFQVGLEEEKKKLIKKSTNFVSFQNILFNTCFLNPSQLENINNKNNNWMGFFNNKKKQRAELLKK